MEQPANFRAYQRDGQKWSEHTGLLYYTVFSFYTFKHVFRKKQVLIFLLLFI